MLVYGIERVALEGVEVDDFLESLHLLLRLLRLLLLDALLPQGLRLLLLDLALY